MDIQLNLVNNWKDITLAEIRELRKQGFVFDTFRKWKPIQIDELNGRMGNLTGEKLQRHKKRFTEKVLKEDFKQHLIISYMGLKHRLIEPKPRKIHYATDFECPDEYKEGLGLLKDKISKGNNLFPHLSRTIFQPKKHDGMYYDWGIHHLHLGIGPDKKYKHLNQGTKKVLYAFFDVDNAYFLCINDHGKWTDESLLRTLHRDFRHVIEPYKLVGILPSNEVRNKKERTQLRGSGITVPVEIDGDNYMPPGLGVTTSGDSLRAVLKMGKVIQFFQVADDCVKQAVRNYLDGLPAIYPDRLQVINLKMTGWNHDSIIVIDMDIGLHVHLYTNQEGTGFTHAKVFMIET